MKQNSRNALAVDTYSSCKDYDDGCGGEYVQNKLSNHTQQSTRWMKIVDKLINWADIYKSPQPAVRCAVIASDISFDQRIWRYADWL